MRTLVFWGVMVAAVCCPVWAEKAVMYDDRPKIAVTGEAVVKVAPDKVLITFGIETWDNEIKAAKKENDEVFGEIIKSIEELGVEEGDIATDHISIEPRHKDSYRKKDFIGYYARNTFVVTLHNIEQVEPVVTKALEAGVDHIYGIDFQTTEYLKHREQARMLALKAAKEKAEKMAAVYDQKIGAAIDITEQHVGLPWWYYSTWSGWGQNRNYGMTQNVVQTVPNNPGEITDTVELGKIAIRANVSVTFELAK